MSRDIDKTLLECDIAVDCLLLSRSRSSFRLTVYFQAMRETMVSLAREKQQTQEPVAAAERVRRMSVCVEDMRRASHVWCSSDQLAVKGRGSDRRKSVLDLVGNIDEGFTALSWSVTSV